MAIRPNIEDVARLCPDSHVAGMTRRGGVAIALYPAALVVLENAARADDAPNRRYLGGSTEATG